MSFPADVQSVVTEYMLLSVFFLSGVLAADGPALSITAPQNLDALRGSCLQIPCNYSTKSEQFDSKGTIFVVWMKNDSRFSRFPENVIFNSSRTINNYPVRIIGNLTEKNCTTLFTSLKSLYSDKYFFRIENGQFLATASRDFIQITVKDSPPSPRIEIPAELKENQLVNITCWASTPCPESPPKLIWNLQVDSPNVIVENSDRTLKTTIQHSIILSDKHDGFEITCSAGYPVNDGKDNKSAEGSVTLDVLYAPKDTSVVISPSGSVAPGSLVNLSCSSRAKPPVSRFTWLKSGEPAPVSDGSFYSFNVTSAAKGGDYYCEAENDLGKHTSSKIHLTIQEQPHIFGQWKSILGGICGIILLICVIIFALWLKKRHQTSQDAQRTFEEPAFEEQATKMEDIHYEELNFSKTGPKPSSDRAQDGERQQDVVYAQVKPKNGSAQGADKPQDIYAQVKKY